ncbi:unnamed protein product, partial [Symbiodinium sp. KB8]
VLMSPPGRFLRYFGLAKPLASGSVSGLDKARALIDVPNPTLGVLFFAVHLFYPLLLLFMPIPLIGPLLPELFFLACCGVGLMTVWLAYNLAFVLQDFCVVCVGAPGSDIIDNRIALCKQCAVRCPFCAGAIRQEDLHSVTDRPATLLSCSTEGGGGEGSAVGPTAGIDLQTLEEFNLQLKELADKVQKRMRALSTELAVSASGHPEILELLEQARKLVDSLDQQGLRPDGVTYQWLISLHARAKDKEHVEAWAYKMENCNKCSTDAYNSVMFGFAVPQGIDRADMWFNRMLAHDVAPDVKTFAILIQACAASRDSTRASRYFQRMQRFGIAPNVVVFSQLISACASEDHDPRSLQKAEGFFKSMQQSGVEPNNFTFMRLLKACANAGDARKASQYFNLSVEAGCVPNVVTYTQMVSVFIKNGDVAGAERWFSKLEAAGITPNVAAFNSVIRVCGTAGDVKHASSWLEKLEAAGCHPTEHTYEALITSVLYHKDFVGADRWLQRMLDTGVPPTIKIFIILLKACEHTGNLCQAEKWFNKMIEAGVQPDVQAYNSILKTSAVHDSFGRFRVRQPTCQEQRKWFLKMYETGVQPNEATHDILTRSTCLPIVSAVASSVAAALQSYSHRFCSIGN